MRRRDLFTGRRYDEVLSLDPGHVDLARLNAGAPLLNAHGAFDLANVLGVVERAWIGQGGDGFEGRAVVRFSEREDVEPFWQDVRAGIIRSVSVGYQVRTYEVSEQDGQPPLWRAIDWVPLELSAVPVGADQAAGFRARQTLAPCHLIHRAGAAQQQETTVMDQTTPAADIRADADSDTPILTSKDAVRRDRPEAAARTAEEIASHNDEPAAAPAKPSREPDPDPDPAQAAEDIARRVVVEERGRISGIYDAAKKHLRYLRRGEEAVDRHGDRR
ncbi:MAG: hypothetical protein ACXWUR_14785 [Allosphingosinicella sp.]